MAGKEILPDPGLSAGPFRPFTSDPGRGDAWWWLGIPAVLAASLVAIHQISRSFYEAWILPEGYGFLELGHFFIPLAAFIIAVRLVMRPFVRKRWLLFAFLVLAALANFYIAGEEMSWGQHFFNWSTPEYWAEINRQQETNIHNVSAWFNHRPRLVLEVGVLVGGLLVPLAALFAPAVRRNRWSLFLPANALVPTALGIVLFKSFALIEKGLQIHMPISRPAEATETFLYMFLLYYLIVMVRRIGELEAEAAG